MNSWGWTGGYGADAALSVTHDRIMKRERESRRFRSASNSYSPPFFPLILSYRILLYIYICAIHRHHHSLSRSTCPLSPLLFSSLFSLSAPGLQPLLPRSHYARADDLRGVGRHLVAVRKRLSADVRHSPLSSAVPCSVRRRMQVPRRLCARLRAGMPAQVVLQHQVLHACVPAGIAVLQWGVPAGAFRPVLLHAVPDGNAVPAGRLHSGARDRAVERERERKKDLQSRWGWMKSQERKETRTPPSPLMFITFLKNYT